jgi:hypothetical protein
MGAQLAGDTPRTKRGDPEDKETAHKAVARYSQWFRVFSLGGEARLHTYLCSGFQIPKGHIHSVARLRLGCYGLRVDRGRWEGGRQPFACIRCQQPDLQPEGIPVPDTEYHALFVCNSTSRVRTDYQALVNRCTAFGNPQAAMRELMHNHDIKHVASFIDRCLRQAVPTPTRMFG